MKNNYLKHYGIWLGGGLLLAFLLGYIIYLPLFHWLFLIIGTIVGTVQTQKAEQAPIKFGKAINIVMLIIGALFVVMIIRSVLMNGFEYFGWLLEYILIDSILSLIIAINILLAVGSWYMFEKAGKPGWAILVPVYNIIVLLEIAKKPTWWIAMFFLPIANIVFMIMTFNGISKNFGKDSGFTVGLVFLNSIFFAVLGYGDAKYLPEIARRDSDLLDN